MELEKLTALQLGEKIKQRQVSVLDGVKTVFEQIEKQDSEVHAYLDTYKEEAYKRAEEVQKGIEDGLIPVLLQAYRSRSKIISVLTERKLPVHQRFLRILCLSIMQKSLTVWKKPDWSLSEKQTWMNLPWEVQQRPPLTASPETHGIWNMYQAVLQVVPVQQ